MFNRQKKETEKQQRLLKYAEAETQFAKDIFAAGDIKDPAERVLKLAGIENEITRHAGSVLQATVHKSDLTAEMFKGMTPGMAVMFGIASLFPHAAVAAMATAGASAIAGQIGFPIWSGIRDRRLTKAHKDEAQDHLQKIRALKEKATEAKETLVSEQAADIRQSPFYEELLSKLPDLSREFKGVAAKRFARLEEEKAAAEQAAQKRQPAAQPPALRDYPDFKRVLGGK
ncbi:MAG: hypothetical protein KGQ70_02185 [Alphaproteobacteria bacterium]|nr:hypothetical protein [Alphaproteobacteria bacterium]